jgi:hypothetical protein
MWDMVWPMPFIHVNTVLRAFVVEKHDTADKRKRTLRMVRILMKVEAVVLS